MKKFASIAFAAALATAVALPTAVQADEAPADTQAAAPKVEVTAGKMLYDAKGYRIGAVYRVSAEGDPQLILDGKLRTVPASTLSEVDGKLTTSLTKREIARGS